MHRPDEKELLAHVFKNFIEKTPIELFRLFTCIYFNYLISLFSQPNKHHGMLVGAIRR